MTFHDLRNDLKVSLGRKNVEGAWGTPCLPGNSLRCPEHFSWKLTERSNSSFFFFFFFFKWVNLSPPPSLEHFGRKLIRQGLFIFNTNKMNICLAFASLCYNFLLCVFLFYLWQHLLLIIDIVHNSCFMHNTNI